jgi:hypothetical protein
VSGEKAVNVAQTMEVTPFYGRLSQVSPTVNETAPSGSFFGHFSGYSTQFTRGQYLFIFVMI